MSHSGPGASSPHRGLLLIAARAPVAGQCKTRLGASIGMERAATLYAAFLRDIDARFTPCANGELGFDVGWAFTPAEVDFAALLETIGCSRPPAGVRFVPQHGDDWGARQANLLHWGVEQGYVRTVLIASDSPQLSLPIVQAAFAVLDEGDVALARSLDGGYSLIGMRGYHDLLTGVPMSTASAADALAARAATLGLRLAELPYTFDVDEAEDLELLRATLSPDGAAAPETWAALQRIGLAETHAQASAKATASRT